VALYRPARPGAAQLPFPAPGRGPGRPVKLTATC